MVDFALLFERKFEAYLLSAVGPCVVLGLLGHVTFIAYPLHHFNERAATALSLLIVVAALFSQVCYFQRCIRLGIYNVFGILNDVNTSIQNGSTNLNNEFCVIVHLKVE